YECSVVALGTDNDGGMRSGRGKLEGKRPWMLTFPCGAHQGHLSAADYFKVNPEAEETSEQATELIGWLNNHGRVRCIFNQVQKEQSQQVKSYLVGNTTRWTTHLIAFLRLEELKQPLRTAALTQRDAIIDAQVGAEKNFTAAGTLRAAAEKQIDVIEDSTFWRNIAVVNGDLEPIAYATNICQSDKARPDVVLLAFVGMFLHFKTLPPERANVSRGMVKRLERRWAGFDQPLMITALILNPYEHLDRFGPDAAANIINVNATIVELYSRVTSHPPPPELDPEELEKWHDNQLQRCQKFSAAFLHYCSFTGPFRNWNELKVDFQKIHDPVIFWESMKADRDVAELANFALKILCVVMNTAGNERQFSKIKICKDRLRNRLQLERLKWSIKIAENLRNHQKSDGLRDERQARRNHSDEQVSQLLQVPRYGQLVQEDGINCVQPALVTNRRRWRAELEQWTKEAERYDELFRDDAPPLPETHGTLCKWLPRSLALLFGGNSVSEIMSEGTGVGGRPQRARRSAFSREQLLMELLAQEREDGMLDDGALEGSGDDYDGN
ncbi:ribonuclease H-like domain-containing protein, partial [Lentinula detonsa]